MRSWMFPPDPSTRKTPAVHDAVTGGGSAGLPDLPAKGERDASSRYGFAKQFRNELAKIRVRDMMSLRVRLDVGSCR